MQNTLDSPIPERAPNGFSAASGLGERGAGSEKAERAAVAPAAAALGIDPFIAVQYYETRLAPDAETVDYLLSVQRGAAAVVAERIRAAATSSELDTEEWQTLARFFAHWADGASLTSAFVPTTWLEYDRVFEKPAQSAPSLCACITPGYSVSERHPEKRDLDLRLCRDVLGALRVELERSRDATLSAVFDQLPSGARWIHLSYMLGREPRALKLYGAMSRTELPAYLERIGWAGDRTALQFALAELYPAEVLGDELFLDLDLENFRERGAASLGLAVARQHLLRGPLGETTHEPIAARWQRAGLCDAGKLELARNWPSPSESTRPFLRETRFLDLKLVWRARTGFEAKAYFGLLRQRGLF